MNAELHTTDQAPGRAAPAALAPMHRQILEALVKLNESGPGWGSWVVAGDLNPVHHSFPYSTLKAMSRRGYVTLGKAAQDTLWVTRKPFTTAELTRDGAAALAAALTTPTVDLADLAPAHRSTLAAVAAGRVTRSWEAQPYTVMGGVWNVLVDGERVPNHPAWDALNLVVADLARLGLVRCAAAYVFATGAAR